jgi:hypothetical protein
VQGDGKDNHSADMVGLRKAVSPHVAFHRINVGVWMVKKQVAIGVCRNGQ